MDRSPFLGAIFEGFIAAEIIKNQINSGQRRELYYFRDQQGLEVDFVVPSGHRKLTLVEVKASRTVTPEAAESVVRLAAAISSYRVRASVVHRPSKNATYTSGLRAGVKAVAWTELAASLA
ncbi:MAG: DUF4143 domain-containing protein [Deltaproteobacteria bacterium]|nr:DUF4143 domain-containing protein [Deltaproteobacteria bacterium]